MYMDQATTEFYEHYAADGTIKNESAHSAISKYFEGAFSAGGKVLDVGSGSGRDLAILHQLGFDAYGVEPNESMRSYALRSHPELVNRLQAGALPEIGNPFGGQFDGIVCSAVMMHIPDADLRKSVASIRALLNPRGRVLIALPLMDPTSLQSERDPDGRYFINHALESVIALMAEFDLAHVGPWDSGATLRAGNTLWTVLLFEISGDADT
jgi:SAM-dependent methyltransferase